MSDFRSEHWEPHVGLDYVAIKPASVGCHLEEVARVYGRHRKDAEARATIMASAPELLAACEEFVRKVEAGEARSVRSYEQMKAAIAKAKAS